jgi:hypothetical protein
MIVNGTPMKLDNGRIGLVTNPQGGAAFERWEFDGNPNRLVYAVLDHEIGEIRYFTEAAVQKMIADLSE